MDSAPQVVFSLKDRSYLSIIKKDVSQMAAKAGFSAKRLSEFEIVISEIGTNLLKHAGGGDVIIRIITDSETPGVEIISIDNGPGMSDPAKMMEDGVSTTGTLGGGLGAIRRLSDFVQVYSVPGWGTVLLARLFDQNAAQGRAPRFGIFPIVVAKPGESHCGDLIAWKSNPYFLKVLLSDGLGHGGLAWDASKKAEQAFHKSVFNAPHQILMDIHTQVKSTRGLVATVAVYDITNKTWQICGVGNISSRFRDAISSKSYQPYNGIIGVNVPRQLESQTVRTEPGRHLILCSDGISSRWDLSKHLAAFRYDQSILAAVIYKDFARHSDDTSVVVVKA